MPIRDPETSEYEIGYWRNEDRTTLMVGQMLHESRSKRWIFWISLSWVESWFFNLTVNQYFNLTLVIVFLHLIGVSYYKE